MDIINNDVISYMREVQPLYDGMLGMVQRECIENDVPVISPETARFMGTLLSTLRPEKILEIGCGTGFSAGLMCRYMQESGHVTTIDRYDAMINQAKVNFVRMGITDKVTLLEGHATDILPTLCGAYDLVFLDAAKGQYLHMLPFCLDLLKTGGVFIADDILQEGRTVSERYSVPRRQRTIHTRMRKFLHTLLHTEGLEASILPLGDGLVFCSKNSNYKGITYEE